MCCCRKKIEELEKTIAEMKEVVEKLNSISPEKVAEQGIRNNPDIITRSVLTSMQQCTITGRLVQSFSH